MKIITVANQKGGVGKTTTAVHLAWGLARYGKRVLILDLDPQGQCATALGADRVERVYSYLLDPHATAAGAAVHPRPNLPNLSLLVGGKQTAGAQIFWSASMPPAPVSVIKDRLRSERNNYDVVMIDTSPSVGGMQEWSLFAADLVVCPTAADFMAAEAIGNTARTLDTLERLGWMGLTRVLCTFVDMTRETTAVLAELNQHYRDALIPFGIHRGVVLRECAANGETVFEHDPRSRAAQEYGMLVEHVRKLVRL